MSRKKRKSRNNESNKNIRTEQEKKEYSYALCNISDWDTLTSQGYVRLSENPEIISAVNKIASLIANMTIHLMNNTENGDVRIQNELSRKIDINPNSYMTRFTFMSALVRCILLEGDGNAVVYPETKDGLLENLFIVPPSGYSFIQDGWGYRIRVNGKEYEPDELIHIAINPNPERAWKGTGCRKSLKSVAETLNQASTTKKGFMESKWKPSIIVKVDGLVDEFSNREGRKKLMNQYIESSGAGEPWLIPADQFDVVTVKPLSLNDLAIKDGIEIDKKTVASLLDIPGFVLGIGAFNKEEWNNFINTRIRSICAAIEQAFTRTLLINPKWYFRFNHRSLLAYDIQTLSTVGCDLYTRGIFTGNEVRDSLGYSPRDGLDELVILENYIPQGMIGNQKKLTTGGEDNG